MGLFGAGRRVLSRMSGIGPSARLLLVCSLPLAGLIIGLAIEQFAPQRRALLSELNTFTAEQHFALRTMLMGASRQVEHMRLTVEQHIVMESESLSEANARKLHTVDVHLEKGSFSGVEWGPAATVQEDGNLLGIPELPSLRGDAAGPVDAALELLSMLRLDKIVGSNARWSYFMPANAEFVAIYPGASLADLVQAAKEHFAFTDMRQFLGQLQNYPVFQLGLPQNNPDRTPYWTKVYDDAGDAGPMVSQAAPVYVRGQFRGVVGTDILLSSFDAILTPMKQPLGLVAIFNDHNELLGLNGAAFDGDLQKMRAYLIADGLLQKILALKPDDGFSFIDDNWIISRVGPYSGYRLIYVLPDSDLNAYLFPRFISYALILCGLIAMLAIILRYLHTSYILPSFRLADYLGARAAGIEAAAPILPKGWQPSFERISEAFANSRNYQERLEESEARFLAAASSLIDGFAIVSSEGLIVFYNEAFARLLGPEGRVRIAIGSYLPDLLDPGWLDAHDPEPMLLDGRWLSCRKSAMPDGGTVILLRDITEARQAELQLRESETRLAALLAYAPVVIMLMDVEGRLIMANPEAERMLNRELGMITGKRMSDFINSEAMIALDASIKHVLATGEVHVSEEHYPGRDHYRDALAILFPLHNTDGAIDGVGIFAVDLTLQKLTEEELRRQRDALYQNEKLAALGSLLAGVAHELNNPLSIVVGYAGMLQELASDEPTRRRAREVHVAAERCARIVKRFLAMARSKPVEKKWVNVESVIDDVMELAAYGLRVNGVEVIRDRVRDLPAILADADQLHQVFMNLVLNAMQAMTGIEGRRRLIIKTTLRGQAIVIDVLDTGLGVNDTVKQRAFEPFFTTKPLGVGTGIGLSLCSGIVEAHGGTITLDSGPGGGALCRVVLPISAAPPLQGTPEQTIQWQPLAGRVLIVDDEASIASFIAEALERDGADVTTVTSGYDAQTLLAEQPFDVVLTDLRMPGVGGERLLAFIAEERPDLKGRVVVMTGDALTLETGLRCEGLIMIEKPIDIGALRALLQSLLNVPSRAGSNEQVVAVE
ncbi:Histidine kinase [Hyphomicrobiales bacterium]|nr:Histidine kinase [Hyphomicrobiales bacterium]CAH1689026.1 Histidine kinase [Hyphomicrobiales bacterium]